MGTYLAMQFRTKEKRIIEPLPNRILYGDSKKEARSKFKPEEGAVIYILDITECDYPMILDKIKAALLALATSSSESMMSLLTLGILLPSVDVCDQQLGKTISRLVLKCKFIAFVISNMISIAIASRLLRCTYWLTPKEEL